MIKRECEKESGAEELAGFFMDLIIDERDLGGRERDPLNS